MAKRCFRRIHVRSPIGLERSVHGTVSSFIFLPFVMRPFSKSALCVGCRTSLRALIRGLANQFKYQRRARRNFISFPISCACVGGFNSVPAPLIPTNSPPPRRTVTHLFAQECHRCRFSIYTYTLSSTYSPSTIAHYSCSFLFRFVLILLPFHLVCMFGRCTACYVVTTYGCGTYRESAPAHAHTRALTRARACVCICIVHSWPAWTVQHQLWSVLRRPNNVRVRIHA